MKHQDANFDLSAADLLVCLIVTQLFHLIARFLGGGAYHLL